MTGFKLPRVNKNILRLVLLGLVGVVIVALLTSRPTYDPEAMVQKVREYSLEFKYDEALQTAEDALTIVKNGGYPDTYVAKFYLLRGQMWLNVYEWDYALSDFNAAITLAPDYPEAYYLRALFYANVADIDSAIIDFSQVVILDPTGPYAANASAAKINLERQRDSLGEG